MQNSNEPAAKTYLKAAKKKKKKSKIVPVKSCSHPCAFKVHIIHFTFCLGQWCLLKKTLPFLWECCWTELLITVVKSRLEATGTYPPFIIPMNVLPSYRNVLCCCKSSHDSWSVLNPTLLKNTTSESLHLILIFNPFSYSSLGLKGSAVNRWPQTGSPPFCSVKVSSDRSVEVRRCHRFLIQLGYASHTDRWREGENREDRNMEKDREKRRRRTCCLASQACVSTAGGCWHPGIPF